MQLTAALLATLALLCTVFFNFAQAVPLTSFRHDASACASLTDCDSCVHASRCGFSLDTQSCASKDSHAGRLVTSATQCKKAIAIHAAREWYIAARAESADAALTETKARALDRRVSDTKPYECPRCFAAFSTKAALARHRASGCPNGRH